MRSERPREASDPYGVTVPDSLLACASVRQLFRMNANGRLIAEILYRLSCGDVDELIKDYEDEHGLRVRVLVDGNWYFIQFHLSNDSGDYSV